MLLSDYDIRVSNILAYLLVMFKFEKIAAFYFIFFCHVVLVMYRQILIKGF